MKSNHLFLIVVILFALCSCNTSETKMSQRETPVDKNIYDVTTTFYTDSELKRIVSFFGSFDELDKYYPIECLRICGSFFRVSYLGKDNQLVCLFFSATGNRIIGELHKMYLTKTAFSSISAGDTLLKIKQIDPEGEYPFLHSGRNDTPKESYHYTTDGYLFTFRYNENNVVYDIECELI